MLLRRKKLGMQGTERSHREIAHNEKMPQKTITFTPEVPENEKRIVKIFMENVYGRTPDLKGYNAAHDGARGHWLEQQMGIQPNNNNSADLLGYEMKNSTKSKTTFGDWSPDERIYKNPDFSINRDEFIRIFGKPSSEPRKAGRYSWSGTPIPKIGKPSQYNGSQIEIDENDDIWIIYSFENDPRPNKSIIVPPSMQKDHIVLARWKKESLKRKLEKKFNQAGWFKCETDPKTERYNQIVFGAPMNFENWIQLVRSGKIYFDGGMYTGNNRPYSQWRANNSLWTDLIIRRYP